MATHRFTRLVSSLGSQLTRRFFMKPAGSNYRTAMPVRKLLPASARFPLSLRPPFDETRRNSRITPKLGSLVRPAANSNLDDPRARSWRTRSNRCVLTAQVKAGEPRRLTEGYLANVVSVFCTADWTLAKKRKNKKNDVCIYIYISYFSAGCYFSTG